MSRKRTGATGQHHGRTTEPQPRPDPGHENGGDSDRIKLRVGWEWQSDVAPLLMVSAWVGSSGRRYTAEDFRLANIAAGVCQPSDLRGRALSSSAAYWRSSGV
jgi:hypothetical protein